MTQWLRLKTFKYYTEIKMKGKKVERRIQNKDYNQVDLWSLLKLGLFWQRGCLTWKKTEKKINSKLDLKQSTEDYNPTQIHE